MQTHSDRVSISQRAMQLAVTTHVYDGILLEEQRILREMKRITDRYDALQLEKFKYERMLGIG